jgi:tRNA G18 (ribose-2'-O)-methylase SpoU
MASVPFLIVGKLAVQSALSAGSRPVYRLFLTESLPTKRADPFLRSAGAEGIPVEALSADELTRRTGVENHGGVAAEVGPRGMSPFEEWMARVAGSDHSPLLFAFENFHEPHNLGYALRCVEALGADGVLLDRAYGEGGAVIAQSSSGAFDRLNMALLDDLRIQFKRLESVGVESLLATAGAMRNFYDFNLRAPVLIAVGGEFKGVSEGMRKACRHTAHLPMADPIPSFPAGHAAAILASEVARQRRLPGAGGPLWNRKPVSSPAAVEGRVPPRRGHPLPDRRTRNR